jgi:hypothetical protein
MSAQQKPPCEVTYRCYRCAECKREVTRITLHTHSLTEAEAQAQKQGWKKARHRWLCSACAD